MIPQRDGRFELAPGVYVAGGALRWTASRSSGPGGQHVNTSATRVSLHCPVAAIQGIDESSRARLRALAGDRLNSADEIVLHAEGTRSQQRNKEAAFNRLCELVRKALHKPKRRIKTKPSRGAVQRRLQNKSQNSLKKTRRSQNFDTTD